MNVIRFFNKFVGSLVLLAIVIVAVIFAVSNQTMVKVSLWPLPIESSFQLGATVLAALALGILVGTALMSWSRMKSRLQAKSSQRKVASLEQTVREAKSTLPPAPADLSKPASRVALGNQ